MSRRQEGLFEYKQPTPLRAIRRFCLVCTGERPQEVQQCPARDCPLHALRLGRVPPERPSELNCIREKCLECAGGNAERVENCQFYECELYLFRMGKIPKKRNAPPVPIQQALAAKRAREQQVQQEEEQLEYAVSSVDEEYVDQRQMRLF